MPILSSVKRSPGLLYCVVIGLLLGALGLAGTADGSRFQSYYFIVQLLALGVGILHQGVGERFAPVFFSSFGRGLGVTLGILLLGVGVALVIYLQTGDLASRWTFATSLLPFVIPFLVGQSYRSYQRIPPADYRKWYYPLNGDMPDLDLLDLSKILVIQFEFLKKPGDANSTNFKAKAPVAMTLGDLFLVFINDYNERTPASPIQYADEAGKPYGWVFAKKTAWWQRRRYLDPVLTFVQNEVADNDTILAMRAE
ncbi:hypothetical protein GCM10027299_10690 [Larkinella ripae]